MTAEIKFAGDKNDEMLIIHRGEHKENTASPDGKPSKGDTPDWEDYFWVHLYHIERGRDFPRYL